jgi:hypothetical protein
MLQCLLLVILTALRLPMLLCLPHLDVTMLQLDYFTSSSRSALRAVFSSWTLDECHAWLSRDVGLQMVLEEETRKWFPASNSGREVSGCEHGCQAEFVEHLTLMAVAWGWLS